jgi:hypothetical protein
MSAPSRNDDNLTRRDELAISGAAMADVPWGVAGAAGAAVAGADLLLHLATLHLAVGSSLSAGAVAFFAVAGAGAVLRKRSSRAARWALNNPWRFAILPGAAAAIVVFVISVIGSGIVGSAFTALWHGAVAYGITGVAGVSARGMRRDSGRSRS